MCGMLLLVAGQLGVTNAVATAAVNIILTGSTIISVILALTTLLSGGLDAIITIGWTAFVGQVKRMVAKKGLRSAIAW